MAMKPVRTGVKPATALKAIKEFCIECMGGDKKEVEHCTAPKCPLFDFRFGKKPGKGEKSDKPKRVLSEETKAKMAKAREAKKKKV